MTTILTKKQQKRLQDIISCDHYQIQLNNIKLCQCDTNFNPFNITIKAGFDINDKDHIVENLVKNIQKTIRQRGLL